MPQRVLKRTGRSDMNAEVQPGARDGFVFCGGKLKFDDTRKGELATFGFM